MYEKSICRLQRDPIDALVDVLAAATRYDLLLGIVPVAFAVALVTAVALGLSVIQTMLVAAVVGVFVVVDACYLNPPIDREQGST